MSRPPEYGVWQGMIQRCTNPKSTAWKHYGGRGISICDRWRNSFELFAADMGPRLSDTHSIDRINNDGNYEPGNCRWATPKEQANNKRRRITHHASGGLALSATAQGILEGGRKALRLKYYQLAAKIGAPQTSVSEWERGYGAPTILQMKALSSLFGVSQVHFYPFVVVSGYLSRETDIRFRVRGTDLTIEADSLDDFRKGLRPIQRIGRSGRSIYEYEFPHRVRGSFVICDTPDWYTHRVSGRLNFDGWRAARC